MRLNQILLILAFHFLCSIPSWADTIYINHAATGANNGTSWANAYTSLHNVIWGNFNSHTYWVAKGTYSPSPGYPYVRVTWRAKLYGGFNGTETHINQRNILANKTILEGSSDQFVVDMFGREGILDGFTIKNGVRGINFFSEQHYMNTVRNCIIENNGIGIFTSNSPNVIVENCLFRNNTAGGIHNSSGTITISNTDFHYNTRSDGGAIYCESYFSMVSVRDSEFIGNTATKFGGAIYAVGQVFLYSSSFNANAAKRGGAIYSVDTYKSRVLENCVFLRNSATEAGHVLYGQNGNSSLRNCTTYDNNEYPNVATFQTENGNLVLRSCILQNGGNEINTSGTTVSITNSIIEGGYASCQNCPGGNGNVDARFRNTALAIGEDNRLGTHDDGLSLDVDSPGIDAGDPLVTTPLEDIRDNPRVGVFDIGAYERCYGDSIIYVNPNATGSNTGSSWANAMTSLSETLVKAMFCRDIKEVWVAEGLYFPAFNSEGDSIGVNRSALFRVVSDMRIYGGFNGTESSIEERDIPSHPTILSGDFNQNDNGFTLMGENTYRIVVAPRAFNFLLDGLILEGANGNPISDGGGAFGLGFGSGKINQCIIRNNLNGRVLHNNGTLEISNSQFLENRSYQQYGGIIENTETLDLNNVFFYNNEYNNDAGVLRNAGTASMGNCVVTGSAYNGASTTNTSAAIYNLGDISILNCTIAGNEVGLNANSGTGTMINNIFWNYDIEFYNGQAYAPSYSIIQDGYPVNTNGNIDQDPQFVNLSNPFGFDGIAGTIDDGTNILSASPAVDGGDPTMVNPTIDISGTLRSGIFDIGAYESICNPGRIYFVNKNASGDYSGKNWANADTSLAKALHTFSNCDIIDEIWVAKGTYYPKDFNPFPDPNPRFHTFLLTDTLSLYGGFSGTESSIDQRDIAANPVILSGDYNNDDVVSGSGDNLTFANNLENASSVISLFAQQAVIDGFTITGGNSDFGGGGITADGTNAEIVNCLITKNEATFQGGGFSVDSESNLIMRDCTFSLNKAPLGGDVYLGFNVLLNAINCYINE